MMSDKIVYQADTGRMAGWIVLFLPIGAIGVFLLLSVVPNLDWHAPVKQGAGWIVLTFVTLLLGLNGLWLLRFMFTPDLIDIDDKGIRAERLFGTYYAAWRDLAEMQLLRDIRRRSKYETITLKFRRSAMVGGAKVKLRAISLPSEQYFGIDPKAVLSEAIARAVDDRSETTDPKAIFDKLMAGNRWNWDEGREELVGPWG